VDDDTAPSQDSVQLQLHGYEGPLELLLELARGQRVDLARISVTALVDQFVTAVTAMQRRDLARATEWLVMAAWLTWLKSRLMLPQGLEEAKQGSEAGQVLIDRLAELDRIRSIATWLEAQPQLGRDMFERGHGYTQMGPVVAADLAGLFQASGRRVADTWASLGRSFPPSRNRPMTHWTISGSISTIVSKGISEGWFCS